MRTLYLSYFGLREPLVNTQVLPYLCQLNRQGIDTHLLTFEPQLSRWPAADRLVWQQRLAAEGIHWHCLAYHARPSLPATVYDMIVGAWHARRLVRQHGIDVLHGRALVATVMGGFTKRLTGRPLIFDIRGLNCEEYVEGGVWRAGGLKYRLAKAMEQWAFGVADGFVVLTERAREHLFPGDGAQDRQGRPVEVIPCCVDWQRFAPAPGASRESAKAHLGLAGRKVVVYVGALGGIYLSREMARYCALAHEADAATSFLFLTKSARAGIAGPLRELGVPGECVRVVAAAPDEVPGYLRAADYALSFRRPSYSQIAASPTKIAEYLASGLPVLSNVGIGDVDAFLEADGVGVLLSDFDAPSLRAARARIEALARDPETPARCAASARDRFDLEAVGGARYGRLYRRILERDGALVS